MRTIIALAGLTGSGKSTVINNLKEEGIPTYYTKSLDNIIETEKMNHYKKYKKPTGIIEALIKKSKEETPHEPIIALDSIRTEKEYELIRSQPSSYIVATICPYNTRIKRINKRDKHHKNPIKRLYERDEKELGITSNHFNLGSIIGRADYYINTGKTRSQIKKQIKKMLAKIRENR